MNPLLAILGLPPNAADPNSQGAGVDRLIVFVHILMFALFVGWIIYFVWVLFRFSNKRNQKADYTGVKSHFSTYVEGLVAAVEAALLLCLALPVWSRTVDKFPSEKESTVIHIIAKQFQWNAWYPTTNGTFVKADAKFVTGEDPFGFDKSDPNFKNNFVQITDFILPAGKPVIAYITSQDVIHSFSCRPLRTMQDAIPGMAIPAHFTPKVEGTYMINCAQLCGSGHSAMRGTIKIVSQAEYDKWYAGKLKGGAAASAGFE